MMGTLERSWRAVAVVVALAACALAAFRLQPLLRSAVDPSAFSTVAAFGVLRGLDVEAPHPVGANEAVRARIVDRLRGAGYAPREQRGGVCSAEATCATVTNVIARLEGSSALPAVLLTAHYDSVPGGPGVADDAAGVAIVLEVARLLKRDPAPLRPIVFLLTDGEEAGLLGARLFASSAEMSSIGAVINLEARGGSGPSLMFEASAGNGWLVDRMAKGLPHPVMSSLFDFVYRMMPNDTDFSVYRALGIPGVNFAFIGSGTRYHSAADNLTLLDPGSLQDQGDHALAMVRSLASAKVIPPSKTEADHVFVDWFGAIVLHWPIGATLPLALAVLVVLAALCHALVRAKRATWRWVALALASSLISVVLAAAIGWLSLRVLAVAGGSASPWPPSAVFLVVAVVVGAGLALALGALVLRHATPEAAWMGVWSAHALLAVALAVTLPVATYLVLPSVIAAAFFGGAVWIAARFGRGPRLLAYARGAAVMIPTALSASLFTPLGIVLYDALGLWWLHALTPIAALGMLGLLPALAGTTALGRRFAVALFVVWGASTALLTRSANFDAHAPARVPIEHIEDTKEGAAQILAMPDTIPDSLQHMGFQGRGFRFSWARPWQHLGPSRRIEPIGLVAPELVVAHAEPTAAASSTRIVSGVLQSKRGAARVAVLLPSERIGNVTVNGASVPTLGRPTDGLWKIESATTPAEGVVITLEVRGSEPIEAIVLDATPGLPPGSDVATSLPTWAVSAFDGHQTVAARHQQL